MFAKSSKYGMLQGVTLVFGDSEDMEAFIKRLQNYLRWAKFRNVNPPYFCCVHDKRIPTDELSQHLDYLKSNLNEDQETPFRVLCQ